MNRYKLENNKSKRIVIAIILLFTLIFLASCNGNKTPSASEPSRDLSKPQEDSNMSGKDEYPHDLKKDRKGFDSSNIDITVGDNLYATQINDWYANTEDYVGRSVEIEGYYVDLNKYSFIGRYGPSCPYCKGGYVSFEFKGDADLSKFESGKTWIKVQGILRQGHNSIYGPFPYIEAINIEKMSEIGLDTVTN